MTSNILLDIGTEIQKAMVRKQISLATLCTHAHLTEEQLCKIIRAEVDTDLGTLATIASALDVKFIITRSAGQEPCAKIKV